MILDVEFQENNCELEVEFEEAYEVSDGGYEKGYADGNAAGYEAGHADGHTEGYQQGRVEDGTQYATQVLFSDMSVFDKPEVEIMVGDATRFQFQKGNTIVKHITINGNSSMVSWDSAFNAVADDGILEQITLNIDLSRVESFSNCFRFRRHLKVIDGQPIDFSSATAIGNYVCYLCNSLEEIRIVPGSIHDNLSFNTSGKLSAESVQSIFDGLADLTGATAKTLTFSTSTGRNLTEEQKASASAKNWTIAY